MAKKFQINGIHQAIVPGSSKNKKWNQCKKTTPQYVIFRKPKQKQKTKNRENLEKEPREKRILSRRNKDKNYNGLFIRNNVSKLTVELNTYSAERKNNNLEFYIQKKIFSLTMKDKKCL